MGVFIFTSYVLIFIVSWWIRNRYNCEEIKEEITDIETLKKAYRKLIKKTAKIDIFISLGTYTLLLVVLVMWFVWYIIYKDGDLNFSIYNWIAGAIILFGYDALF